MSEMGGNQVADGMGLLDRLERGPVICAEGYLFEFERRGYLQAGAFVPEVVLEHPDLSEFVGKGDSALKLEEHDDEHKLFVPGDIDPARGSEIEEAVWARMQFASHLRSERLGEFTIGTELHRSESLAVVQVLMLYHLVTARAAVALGSDGARADREPAPAPQT